MKDGELRLMIDVIAKYVVLFTFTAYIGVLLHAAVTQKISPNFPDWLVMLYTMVFTYFFRKSPKEPQNKGGE